MEIYNESVRDLLSNDTTPLRLLDDPEVNIITNYWKMIMWTEIGWQFLLNRKAQLLRNSPRKLWKIGTILQILFLSVKVRTMDSYDDSCFDGISQIAFFICVFFFFTILCPPRADCIYTNPTIFSAQRQIGETSLNEVSSRSHQILRLVSGFLSLLKEVEIFQYLTAYLS
jgi:hypothetical protein